MRNVKLLILGTLFGVGLVIACGEMTHGAIDAGVDAKAQSDCTTCEKPLAGRIYRSYQTQPESTTSVLSTATAVCQRGNGIVLGGGCEIFDPATHVAFAQANRHLLSSTASHGVDASGNPTAEDQAWICAFDRADDGKHYTITATVICLDQTQ